MTNELTKNWRSFLRKAKDAIVSGQGMYLLRKTLRMCAPSCLLWAAASGLSNEVGAYRRLRRKYGYVLKEAKPVDSESLQSDTIWTCWLQGQDNAPPVSSVCIRRMQEFFGPDRVQVITADNFADFVTLPDYIIDKWHRGTITHTHFSDILRLALLCQWGGRGSTLPYTL